MERADVLVTGATIVDGTGAPGRVGDVAVVGDRFVDPATVDGAATIVDGTGLVAAPGFIDVHTHDDWAVLVDPSHACKTMQGVTTVVTGNCGSSPAPITTDANARYPTMAAYLAELDQEPAAVNVAALVGHGAIRGNVIGMQKNRRAGEGELRAMLDHVAASLEAGCIGLSTGLAYEPGKYADADEIERLAALVAAADGIYTSHMRNEADGLLDAVDETIAVGDHTGVRVQISHLKAAGRGNWGTVVEALARIDAARARGVDVMADQYPYTRGSTLLEQVVRAGSLDGGSAFGGLGPEQVLVAAAPRQPEWEGRTLAELATDAGIDARAMADRMVAEAGRTCFVVLDIMSEDDVETVMAHGAVMIGSDGVPAGSKPHPRLHHTYPRVLGEYVRVRGHLDLATAVHRMTGLCASQFRLADRGEIRPGAYADLVLFDADEIVDTGTYEAPTTPPLGIRRVLVNGRTVVADGEVADARPGRVLRRGEG